MALIWCQLCSTSDSWLKVSTPNPTPGLCALSGEITYTHTHSLSISFPNPNPQSGCLFLPPSSLSSPHLSLGLCLCHTTLDLLCPLNLFQHHRSLSYLSGPLSLHRSLAPSLHQSLSPLLWVSFYLQHSVPLCL